MTISEAWVDFLAGWASGAVAVAVVQPVDTVLTRSQAAVSSTSTCTGTGTAATTLLLHPKASTMTPWQQLTYLSRTFGVTSLWRGSSAMISAVPLQNALLMGGYGVGKQWSSTSSSDKSTSGSDTDNNHNLASVFVGGCVGGIAQSFLMSPVELIKVQQQVHNVVGASASASAGTVPTTTATATTPSAKTAIALSEWSLIRSLFFSHSQNHRQLWQRGLHATLLRDGIPHGVWFVAYEWSKTELMKSATSSSTRNDDHERTIGTSTAAGMTLYPKVGVPMLAGAFAATVAWAVGYPFDIIKTRIQANALLITPVASTTNGTTASMNISPHAKGVFEVGKELVQEYGFVRGLYRGFGLKLVRAIPASMVGFLTYETVAEWIRGKAD